MKKKQKSVSEEGVCKEDIADEEISRILKEEGQELLKMQKDNPKEYHRLYGCYK